MTTYDEINAILEKLSQQLCVHFALYCCDDIKDLIKNEDSIKAIALAQLWLDTDGAGIPAEELRAAAYAADASADANAAYAAYAAAYAAYAAANAAYAADAASAAWAAAAASAAATAANTAFAAYRNEKLSQYKTYLLKMVAELTELERLIYDLNMEAK